MDFFSLIASYLVILAVLIFLLLFGEAAIFIDTPIASLHWLLFSGVCEAFWWVLALLHTAWISQRRRSMGLEPEMTGYGCFLNARWVIGRTAGTRGKQVLERWRDRCAESSSPVLQIFYIVLLAVGFYYYTMEIFCFLPQAYAPEWHKYTGTATLGACLLAFYIASVSDPGRISADNVAAHCALYPYDELTSRSDQQCWSCLWQRPARSKHCPACNRCIARFDHHCAWINNCVGLLNLRHFMVFLVANMVLCSYGLGLGCIIMHGVLEERSAWTIVVRERASGRTYLLGSHPRVLMRWMLQQYPVVVAELIFLGVAMLLVVGFFAYHMWLISRGTTTYETFKWREVARRERAERMAEAANGEEHSSQPLSDAVKRPFRQPKHMLAAPLNIYDKGCITNLKDALVPPAWAERTGAVQTKKKT